MSVEELERRMKALLVGEVGENRVVDIIGTSRPSETVEGASYALAGATSFHERMQKLDWIEKLNNHLSNLTGIVAKAIGKYSKEGGNASNAAKGVEDFAKIIPGGISSVFHLVLLTARLVSMFAEASRGRKELPAFLVKVGELLQCVTESIIPVLQSSPPAEQGELLLEGNVFEVLVTVFDTMGKVERQLLRSFKGQAFKAAVVSEVESELDTLRTKVVGVVLTKRVTNMEVVIGEVIEKVESRTMSGILPVRPRKSVYFMGRGKELDQLKQVVGKYGSAAISGFGGLGKSQLMAAFADRAEATGDIPGDVYWVIADGNASQVVGALATFVEKLKDIAIPEKERKKPEVVLSALKNVLSEASGRWLLCLDNVDNAGDTAVRGILDKVAAMAEPTKSNGWVVVTSRCGDPSLWNSMEEGQNIVLCPLSAEDGMYVLWRYKKSIRSDKAKDGEIAEAVSRLKQENENEHRALRELCGFEWNRSLAGLPLALIQAGAYIRRCKCSFAKYLELYRESNEKSELEDILQEAEDLTLKPEQRAILTTWAISMRRLSVEARLIVRAVAMLGNAHIPEDLVKETLRGSGERERNRSVAGLTRLFHKLVLGELVFDSSLLRRYGNDAEASFELHRLVRMFILVEMRQDKEVLQNAFEKAVVTTHSCLDSVLRKGEKAFNSWPNSRADDQFRYFPHSLSLVNHFTSSPSLAVIMQHSRAVPEVFEFAGACLYWTGRLEEAAVVQENVVSLYSTIHDEIANNTDKSSSMHELGLTYYAQGKLGEAEEMYRKALDMMRSIHDRDEKRSSIAASLHELGRVFQAQGKLGKAEKMYRKSLDRKYSIHGRDAKLIISIAVSLHQLAHVFCAQGKLGEAEGMYGKSLDMKYSILGRDAKHDTIACSLNGLGSVFRAQGKLGDAEEMFRKALDMMYSIHGRDAKHGDIAISLHALGYVLEAKGKLGEAKEIYRKSLDVMYFVYGQDSNHDHINFARCSLGRLLEKEGRNRG